MWKFEWLIVNITLMIVFSRYWLFICNEWLYEDAIDCSSLCKLVLMNFCYLRMIVRWCNWLCFGVLDCRTMLMNVRSMPLKVNTYVNGILECSFALMKFMLMLMNVYSPYCFNPWRINECIFRLNEQQKVYSILLSDKMAVKPNSARKALWLIMRWFFLRPPSMTCSKAEILDQWLRFDLWVGYYLLILHVVLSVVLFQI